MASVVIVVLIGLALQLVMLGNSTKDANSRDQHAKRTEQTPKDRNSNPFDSDVQQPNKTKKDRPEAKNENAQVPVRPNPDPIARAVPQPAEMQEAEQPLVADNPEMMADAPLPGDSIPRIPDVNHPNPTSEGVDWYVDSAANLMRDITSKREKDAIAAFKQAFATLRKGSNLYPKEIRPDFYAGMLHSGIGINDLKVSEVHFRRVLERQPGHAATLNNLALVEVRARRLAVVRNYFGLMSKLDPVPIEVSQNLGRLIANSKLLELKGDDLKKMTALEAQYDHLDPRVGWVYMPLDRRAQSLEEYKPFCRDGRLEDPRCIICSGQQSIVCRLCKGSGTQLQSGTVAQTVVGLYGTVTVTTPVTGQSACRGCGGRGRIHCTACVNGRDVSISSDGTDAYQHLFGNRPPDPN